VKTLAEENEDNIGNLNEIIGTDNDPATATTIKGKLKNLSGKMSDAETYINSLKDKMPSVDTDINSLKERMGTAENDIKGINGDIKEINDNISELASKNEVDLIE
jgi:peptidoglycan hydrolase CwlO-like protein